FEVARRQAEIEVQLAEIIVVAEIYSFVSGIKRIDDARTDRAPSAIASSHDLDPFVFFLIFGENLRRFVGRSVINDDPFGGPDGLTDDRIQRLPHVLRFVAASRN